LAHANAEQITLILNLSIIYFCFMIVQAIDGEAYVRTLAGRYSDFGVDTERAVSQWRLSRQWRLSWGGMAQLAPMEKLGGNFF